MNVIIRKEIATNFFSSVDTNINGKTSHSITTMAA